MIKEWGGKGFQKYTHHLHLGDWSVHSNSIEYSKQLNQNSLISVNWIYCLWQSPWKWVHSPNLQKVSRKSTPRVLITRRHPRPPFKVTYRLPLKVTPQAGNQTDARDVVAHTTWDRQPPLSRVPSPASSIWRDSSIRKRLEWCWNILVATRTFLLPSRTLSSAMRIKFSTNFGITRFSWRTYANSWTTSSKNRHCEIPPIGTPITKRWKLILQDSNLKPSSTRQNVTSSCWKESCHLSAFQWPPMFVRTTYSLRTWHPTPTHHNPSRTIWAASITRSKISIQTWAQITMSYQGTSTSKFLSPEWRSHQRSSHIQHGIPRLTCIGQRRHSAQIRDSDVDRWSHQSTLADELAEEQHQRKLDQIRIRSLERKVRSSSIRVILHLLFQSLAESLESSTSKATPNTCKSLTALATSVPSRTDSMQSFLPILDFQQWQSSTCYAVTCSEKPCHASQITMIPW